jgi:hypothetical protein
MKAAQLLAVSLSVQEYKHNLIATRNIRSHLKFGKSLCQGYETTMSSPKLVQQTGATQISTNGCTYGQMPNIQVDYRVWEGICASPFPTVPSHEPGGTVVQVDPKAKEKFKIGDRMGALLFSNNDHCVNCELFDDIRFCKNVEFKGLKNDEEWRSICLVMQSRHSDYQSLFR